MAKPTSFPEWTIGNPNFGTVTIEPTGGKKITGWTPGEKPPNQYMNWLFYNLDQWVKYLDGAILDIGFDAVVGPGLSATHATLAAALADVGITAGARILVTADETINTTIQITKNNLEIYFKPGVTFSRGAVTTGLQISADGTIIRQGRFAGFVTAGNKAILIDAGSDYSMIRDVRFGAGNDTDIDDLAATTSILGTITE